MEGLLRCPANDVPLSPIGFLERSSVAYGDTTCLVYGSLTRTWAHTHQRCLKLASALAHHLGISRGDVVSALLAVYKKMRVITVLLLLKRIIFLC